MSKPVLQVLNLHKQFREYRSEFARLLSWFGVNTKPAVEHSVLTDISFSVMPGEAIGIVGQNGAGKSTLLKLITGTLKPSSGEIIVNGRIAAILELGMGFNPEFTGRQNVYHSAGLMGISKQKIEEIIPQIEDFAEIGDYFDQPVGTYSSGMQMRVAFSVVTALRPEILIVDEALSVGDAYFQHKCFNRIREFRRQGTTLLVVSHDRGAIQSLCDRAILLVQGKLIKDGAPEEVMDYYNALIADKENSTVQVRKLDNRKAQVTSGTREAFVEAIKLIDHKGEIADCVNVGELVTLSIKVSVAKELPKLVLGYIIKDRLGQDIFGTNTWHTHQVLEKVPKDSTIDFDINFPANLGPGSYSVSTALVSTDTHLVQNYEWRDLAHVFRVVNLDKTTFIGSTWIQPEIEIKQAETKSV